MLPSAMASTMPRQWQMPKIAKKKLLPVIRELVDLYEAGYDNDTLTSTLQRKLEELDNAKV